MTLAIDLLKAMQQSAYEQPIGAWFGAIDLALREEAKRADGNETKWVYNWDEFKSSGGMMAFNEDQTEIKLSLPPPYKFVCSFNHRALR